MCSACEDPVREPSPEKGGSPDGKESKALFHCPTIQGAILGVALHMIEQEFGSQLRIAKPTGVPPAKKRKTSALGKLLNTMQGGDDDSSDSDGGYGFGGFGGRGQAAPKGTGYSGAAHEDVSTASVVKTFNKADQSALWRDRCREVAVPQGPDDRQASVPGPRVSSCGEARAHD